MDLDRENSKVGEFVRLKFYVEGVYRGCISRERKTSGFS